MASCIDFCFVCCALYAAHCDLLSGACALALIKKNLCIVATQVESKIGRDMQLLDKDNDGVISAQVTRGPIQHYGASQFWTTGSVHLPVAYLIT